MGTRPVGSSASPHPCRSRTPTPVGRLGGSSRDEDGQNRGGFYVRFSGSPSQASLSVWGGGANWLHKPPGTSSPRKTEPGPAEQLPSPRPPPGHRPARRRRVRPLLVYCGVAEPRSLGHGRMRPGGRGGGGEGHPQPRAGPERTPCAAPAPGSCRERLTGVSQRQLRRLRGYAVAPHRWLPPTGCSPCTSRCPPKFSCPWCISLKGLRMLGWRWSSPPGTRAAVTSVASRR